MGTGGRVVLAGGCLAGWLMASGCAHAPAVRLPAPAPEARRVIERADRLVQNGCYTCLGDAADLYDRVATGLVTGRPIDAEEAARKRTDTLFVRALRERELGLGHGRSATAAEGAAAQLEAPWEYGVFAAIVRSSGWRTNGVSRELQDTIFDTLRETSRSWRAWHEALRPPAVARDPWAAYAFLALECGQAQRLREAKVTPWKPARADLPPLLRFRLATCGTYDRAELDALVTQVSAFAEIHLFLGELALAAGTLRTAERQFVAALQALPDLTAARVSLGHVYFAMEDLDLARDTYHTAVAAVPGQREALFGEAKALSFLGRHAEAVAVLDRMIELGTWYQGEAHYWRAWNRFRLREFEAADGDVVGARSRLPMDAQVDKLAGQIALARNEPDRAEREFRAALQHMIDKGDRDCDIRYFLGSVLVMRKAWTEAAPHFASAVPCYVDAEGATQRRIGEIQASDLPDDRKARLIAAKERAMVGLQDQTGRAAFNGAAAFFNAGQPLNAKPLAERAASHPELGDQARALLARIR